MKIVRIIVIKLLGVNMKHKNEKEVTLFNNKNTIEDCFGTEYQGQTIGIYNPYSQKLGKYIYNYLAQGYKFIIYLEKSDKDFITSNNLSVTNDFYTFYKESDLFIIEKLKEYKKISKQIFDISEKIFNEKIKINNNKSKRALYLFLFRALYRGNPPIMDNSRSIKFWRSISLV